MSKYGVFSGPYFPVFGLNTGIYGVNLRTPSECRKIRTRKTPYLDTFHAVPIKQNVNVSHAETINQNTKYLRGFTKHLPQILD